VGDRVVLFCSRNFEPFVESLNMTIFIIYKCSKTWTKTISDIKNEEQAC
jgi:hypothetical protein